MLSFVFVAAPEIETPERAQWRNLPPPREAAGRCDEHQRAATTRDQSDPEFFVFSVRITWAFTRGQVVFVEAVGCKALLGIDGPAWPLARPELPRLGIVRDKVPGRAAAPIYEVGVPSRPVLKQRPELVFLRDRRLPNNHHREPARSQRCEARRAVRSKESVPQPNTTSNSPAFDHPNYLDIHVGHRVGTGDRRCRHTLLKRSNDPDVLSPPSEFIEGREACACASERLRRKDRQRCYDNRYRRDNSLLRHAHSGFRCLTSVLTSGCSRCARPSGAARVSHQLE